MKQETCESRIWPGRTGVTAQHPDPEVSQEPSKRRRNKSTDVIRWNEKAGLRTGCGVRSQVIDVLKAQIKRRPAMKKVSIVAAK